MATWLKQSTAIDVSMGPFLDSGDGNTVEDGLTITQPDVRLKKNGGAWAQKNAAQTLSHEENGWYEVALDTTDTNTLGNLLIAIHESGALPVWREFQVVPANVWDSFFGADKLQVDVTQIEGGDATDAITAAVPTAAAIADAVLEESVGDHDGVSDSLAEYVSNTDDRTVGIKAQTDLIPSDPADASVIAGRFDTVDTTLGTLATAANLATVAGFLDTEIAAILADTNELQTDLADGGRLDLLIDAIKAKTDLIPGDQDGYSMAELLLLIGAACLGKASGLATTTAVYRSLDDSKDRITATVDADGNRSAVTLDAG